MNIHIPAWVLHLLPTFAMYYIAISITNGYTYGWPFAQVEVPGLTPKATGRPFFARLAFLLLACLIHLALVWMWFRWSGAVGAGVMGFISGASCLGDVGRFFCSPAKPSNQIH